MRVFLAVDIPEEIKAKIRDIQKNFEKERFDIKFVEPENLHITLKFLGEVSEEEIEKVKRQVSSVVKDFSVFKIEMKEFGYFGNEKYIRTLWIGIGNKERLIELINKLNKKLDYIRKDKHKPSPHLTIGRLKSGKNREYLLKIIEELKYVKIGEVYVKEIKLKQSILTPQGPVYRDIETFSLVE